MLDTSAKKASDPVRTILSDIVASTQIIKAEIGLTIVH